MSDNPAIYIVTPVLNGANFIDETILSVTTQNPDAEIHYHIQDGGSRDKTLECVEAWRQRLDNSFAGANRIHLSVASEPDAGLYDAIARGFARFDLERPALMTWINASDRLAPGAITTMIQVFRRFPEFRFGGGRHALLNQTGALTAISQPLVFPQKTLRAGLHDGVILRPVMQEGTFWTADLYREAGGLDTSLKLAGDFDLWIRFAALSPYLSVDSVTGYHRRHEGQLSGAAEAYAAEAALVRQRHGIASAEAVKAEYCAILDSDRLLREPGFNAPIAVWHPASSQWRLCPAIDIMMFSAVTPPQIGFDLPEGRVAACKLEFGNGFRHAEGPYWQFNLPAGMRWISGAEAEVEVTTAAAGPYELRLHYRNFNPGLRLEIRMAADLVAEADLTALGFDWEQEMVRPLLLDHGANRLRFTTTGPGVAEGRLGELFLLTRLTVAPRPAPVPSRLTRLLSLLTGSRS